MMDDDIARMLGDAAARWGEANYELAQRKPRLALAGAFDAAVWSAYAEMGWLALRLPEADGGLAADAAAVGALMEVAGSRLLLEPLLVSAVVGTGLIAAHAPAPLRERLLPQLVAGGVRLAFTGPAPACAWRDGALHGRAEAVLQGDVADGLIVAACDAAGAVVALQYVEVDAPGVRRRAYRLVDGRGAANFEFEGVAGVMLASGDLAARAAETALAETWVALCAEALGCVRALLAATLEYLKLRQQFGRPLGVNQALQHRAVDLLTLQEEILALTEQAQRALALPAPQRRREVAAARAYISRAARRVANEAVQMHGGVGITDELAVSHHFRRLMVNGAVFGDRDAQFDQFLSCAGMAD
ncbi:MAG: acyl-CoA dehydrogenase family protein [Burkholderiales bacterium]|nr:acyl-CoA dehydrogenase family protein [Burkholderiales bacterium]